MGRGNAIFGLLLSSGFRKIEGCSNESSNRKQKRNGKHEYTVLFRDFYTMGLCSAFSHGAAARFNGIVNSPSGAETRT
jgi:hypothetical protein